MAIEQKTVIVEGSEYLLTQFDGERGFIVLQKLLKVVGPVLSSLAGGDENADVEKHVPLAEALKDLFSKIDDPSIFALVKELVSSASKDGSVVSFKSEFAGNYKKLFLLVQEIVEFNYGNVFTLGGTVA